MLRHVPVMLQEILEYLPKKLDIFVDGTLGHGGHSQAILEKNPELSHILGIDRDLAMISKTQQFVNDGRLIIEQGSYEQAPAFIKKQGRTGVDAILLDLGVNMDHFKDGKRGFSIKENASLDMRFDQEHGIPAYEWLGKVSAFDFSEALQKYGDFSEKYSSFVAQTLVDQRKKRPLLTTFDFKEILAVAKANEKMCAVMFQVVRILINDELGHLERALSVLPGCLNPGGRILVLTYHSIEDRLVKYAFKSIAEQEGYELVNKKIIAPHYTEVQRNKAARSAKLRVLERE